MHHRRAVLLPIAAAAYAWWAAGLRPFTWPALAAVGVAGAAVIVSGTIRARERAVSAADGAVVWAVLLVVLGGWELAAYVQHPRADHPTLSALADQVLDWRPARALAFLAWIALGVDLARR